MPDQYIVEHCSPTLAGLKTGNLFSVRHKKDEEFIREIRELNGLLRDKGLRAIPVRRTAEYALIYLYRPDFLEKDLRSLEAVQILREKGYDCGSAEHCLTQLIERLKADGSFPHEIGLFLGYPPVDVKGFMKSPNQGVKCTGCWKVYGDREQAEKTFAGYRRCTEAYRRQLAAGKTLGQLIVRTAAV